MLLLFFFFQYLLLLVVASGRNREDERLQSERSFQLLPYEKIYTILNIFYEYNNKVTDFDHIIRNISLIILPHRVSTVQRSIRGVSSQRRDHLERIAPPHQEAKEPAEPKEGTQ